jgi:hypothetical protein
MHLPRQTLKLLRHRSLSHPVDESTISVLKDFVGAGSRLFPGERLKWSGWVIFDKGGRDYDRRQSA